MQTRIGRVVVGVVLIACGMASAGEIPVTVSPGSPTGAAIESRCPTFSWDAVADAAAHELVVYRVGEEGKDAEPVLEQQVPGSASSWTPPLDACLERGGNYAWSVRATGGEAASDWSAPSLFEVAAGPTRVEFEEALALVTDYLGTHGDRLGVSLTAAVPPGPETAASPLGTRAVGTTQLNVDGGVVAESFTGDGSTLSEVRAIWTKLLSAHAGNAGRVDAGADAHTFGGSGCDEDSERSRFGIWQTTEGDIFCFCGCQSNSYSCTDANLGWQCFSD